jgi:hypothetical protein
VKKPAEVFNTWQTSRRKKNRWNRFLEIHAAKVNGINEMAFAGMKKGLKKAFYT